MNFFKNSLRLYNAKFTKVKRTFFASSTLQEEKNPVSLRKVKTGVLLMNMGGPKNVDEVPFFLKNLFSDRDLLKLPFQNQLGSFIAKRRSSKIQQAYKEIGGGSPIHHWTHVQGEAMVQELDRISPISAPHKYYVGFRYVNPLTEDAIEAMERDGVERAVAFSQYPQYSCSTTGSSLNAIYKHYEGRTRPSKMVWSCIDRWPTHPKLISSFVDSVNEGLNKFTNDKKDNILILFTAHSLPLKYVMKGDSYPHEVAATVHAVMDQLGHRNPHVLAWQSKVGPLPWLSPSTQDTMKWAEAQGFKGILLVPITFVNDHIETLYELDIEYKDVLSYNTSVEVRRAESMNDRPSFLKCLADVVHEHLMSREACSKKLQLRCLKCPTGTCKHTKRFFRTQKLNMELKEQKSKLNAQPQ